MFKELPTPVITQHASSNHPQSGCSFARIGYTSAILTLLYSDLPYSPV